MPVKTLHYPVTGILTLISSVTLIRDYRIPQLDSKLGELVSAGSARDACQPPGQDIASHHVHSELSRPHTDTISRIVWISNSMQQHAKQIMLMLRHICKRRQSVRSNTYATC